MHFIMAGKQAKILSEQQTRSLLVFASTTRNPRRNHLILLLSLKAGLDPVAEKPPKKTKARGRRSLRARQRRFRPAGADR
jgi:hypothetical protein